MLHIGVIHRYRDPGHLKAVGPAQGAGQGGGEVPTGSHW